MADEPKSERYRSPTDMLRDKRDEAEDRLREADKALKDALDTRIKAGNVAALATLARLVTWHPECGFPHEEDLYRGGKLDEAELKRLNNAPFVSEAYLYALLGKEDARTFLALLGAVCRELGVSDYSELQRPYYEAVRKELDESLEHLTLSVENHQKAGHTLNRDGPCSKCAEVQKKRKNEYDPKRGCIRTSAVESLERVREKTRVEEES